MEDQQREESFTPLTGDANFDTLNQGADRPEHLERHVHSRDGWHEDRCY
jgi:hypothetical protein